MSYLSAKDITCLLTNTGDKTIIGIIINAGEDRMRNSLCFSRKKGGEHYDINPAAVCDHGCKFFLYE